MKQEQPTDVCPTCRNPFPAGAPAGVCPTCIFDLGKSDEASSGALLDSPVDETGPLQVDGFRILEKIGEGGFGAVYLAEQREPVKRLVALKVIKLGMDTAQVIARFEAERQALALMDHPNIAKVLDGGATDQGRPYFVMELVRGIAITEYCAKHRLGRTARLRLFIDVCKAVQHAHQKGVIHRDLKPSNILVMTQDNVPVPKIIDFGVAKATLTNLTERTLHTRMGQFIGTPAYMSPEQAEMGGADIDTRSDVYSLGCILYELLVGSPPLDPDTLSSCPDSEIRQMISGTDPAMPSVSIKNLPVARQRALAQQVGNDFHKHMQSVGGDLDWITMKAVEKDRMRRYGTTLALAEDIENHLENKPVTAAAPSVLYQWQKTFRRHRHAFVSLIAVALALLAGLVAALWQAQRAQSSQRETTKALSEIESIYEKLEHTNYRSNIQLAEARIKAGEFGAATELLWQLPVDQRGWEWGHLLAQIPTIESLGWDTGHGVIGPMAVSHDHQYVVSSGEDKRVALWHLDSGQLVWERRFDFPVYEIAYDPTGKRLAIVVPEKFMASCFLIQLDASTGEVLNQVRFDGNEQMKLLWLPQGLYLFPLDRGWFIEAIVEFDSESWQERRRKALKMRRNPIAYGHFDLHDGMVAGVLGVTADDEVVVVDLETLTQTKSIPVGLNETVYHPYTDMATGWTTVARARNVCRLNERGEFETIFRLDRGVRQVKSVDAERLALADHREVLILGEDGSVKLRWETPGTISEIAALPDGHVLVSSRNGFLRLYDLEQVGQNKGEFPFLHQEECRNVFFTPNGRQLGFMRWHKKATHLVDVPPYPDDDVITLSAPDSEPSFTRSATDVPGFHPLTGELVCHDEAALRFYQIDGDQAKLVKTLPLPFPARHFRFDRSANSVLSFTFSKTKGHQLHAIDLETGLSNALPLPLTIKSKHHRCTFDLSLDGEIACYTNHERPGLGEWGVWRKSSGKVLIHQAGSSADAPHSIAMHPQGTFVAVGFNSGLIEVWDVSNLRLYQRFKHEDTATVMRFGGHLGDRLWTASKDRSLRIWNWRGAEHLLAFPTKRPLRSIALSANGRAVAVGGYQPDVTVRVALPWQFELGDPAFYKALKAQSPSP